MDADFSHNPEYLPALTAARRQRGRRDRLALPERRQRGELAAAPHLPQHVRQSLHPRRHAACQPSDCTSGFRCWRREALARLPLDKMVSDGYAFLVEMLYDAARNGCRIGEVPIIFVERRQGQSKLSSNVIARIAVHAVAAPLRRARR